jgi:hypothetical protein
VLFQVDEVVDEIRRAGFAVVARASLDVRDVYDRAVADAELADVFAKSSTRVADFVNRGSTFDSFWRDPQLLAICRAVFQCPFKLSSFQARAVNPGASAQPLHVDLASDGDRPMLLGFIWMVDDFTEQNGATRFVPRGCNENEVVVASGSRGSLVVYEGGILHGFGANRTQCSRRSLQGAFVVRHLRQGVDQRSRLRPETAARLDAEGRWLLDVE